MPFNLCGGQKIVQRKIVLLGDGACGKTSLLNVFTRGYFPTVYEPTVFENYVHDIFVDGVHIELSLWDTAGQEEFDRLRSLSYDDTHVIMLCFSVDSKDSLENVTTKWANEIKENCKDAEICLIALKCDLREPVDKDDPEEVEKCRGMLDYDAGVMVGKQLHASRYLECSAMRNRGVNEAFSEASRVALEAGGLKGSSSSKMSKCVIM